MWRLCVRVLCLSCARLDAVPFGPWLSMWGYGNIDFRFVAELRLKPLTRHREAASAGSNASS